MSSPSFRFRLERVRDIRERKEDLAKQELAGAMARHTRCEQEVQTAAQRIVDACAAQLDAAKLPSYATDLLSRQAYLERTEQDHRASSHNLRRHELEVTDRREALRHAARDRQALERLKERRRAEHQREIARLEGLELDDIATNNFSRSAA
jgi:flagellar protein FliJ